MAHNYDDVAKAIWPSIDDLLGAWPERYPLRDSHIVGRLKDRWAGGAADYTTDDAAPDGRAVNACMKANNWRDAEEEIVDALFNLLVANFRKPLKEGRQRGYISTLLMLHAAMMKEGNL